MWSPSQTNRNGILVVKSPIPEKTSSPAVISKGLNEVITHLNDLSHNTKLQEKGKSYLTVKINQELKLARKLNHKHRRDRRISQRKNTNEVTLLDFYLEEDGPPPKNGVSAIGEKPQVQANTVPNQPKIQPKTELEKWRIDVEEEQKNQPELMEQSLHTNWVEDIHESEVFFENKISSCKYDFNSDQEFAQLKLTKIDVLPFNFTSELQGSAKLKSKLLEGKEIPTRFDSIRKTIDRYSLIFDLPQRNNSEYKFDYNLYRGRMKYVFMKPKDFEEMTARAFSEEASETESSAEKAPEYLFGMISSIQPTPHSVDHTGENSLRHSDEEHYSSCSSTDTSDESDLIPVEKPMTFDHLGENLSMVFDGTSDVETLEDSDEEKEDSLLTAL